MYSLKEPSLHDKEKGWVGGSTAITEREIPEYDAITDPYCPYTDISKVFATSPFVRLQKEYIENSRRVHAGSNNNTSRYSHSNSRATFENFNVHFVIEEKDPTDPIYTKSGFSVRKPAPGPGHNTI